MLHATWVRDATNLIIKLRKYMQVECYTIISHAVPLAYISTVEKSDKKVAKFVEQIWRH